MLDPIADKAMVAVALMMLVAEGTLRRVNPETGASVFSLLRLVLALIILAREILVSGLREFLAGTWSACRAMRRSPNSRPQVQMPIAIGAMIPTPWPMSSCSGHPRAQLFLRLPICFCGSPPR